MSAKQYTATNPREWSDEKTIATVRYTTIANVLRKVESFPSVKVWKTGLSPYRYEPHHAQEDSHIDKYVEENDTPGIPVDRVKLAEKMNDLGSYKCVVYFIESNGHEEQYVQIRGPIRNYVVHYDENEVRFDL